MGEPIKVRDLVWVAYGVPCCGHLTGAEGMYFVVSHIIHCPGERCNFCGSIRPPLTAFGRPGLVKGFDLPRLKKLPPLTEPETVTQREPAHV